MTTPPLASIRVDSRREGGSMVWKRKVEEVEPEAEERESRWPPGRRAVVFVLSTAFWRVCVCFLGDMPSWAS